MRIKRLIMHNFGVYAATNELVFQGEAPVVLIGGMNGRGKTTILEAVLLGLYGSNSFAYTESKYHTYGQYLRSYVNKADNTLETYVDLEFSMDESDSEIYYVHREWDANGKRVKEKIRVKKNGEENAFLTENWPMFIENILPSALSSFFFFDGEKIAELAVEDTSEQMKQSIKAMLGISVLDVLEGDLGRLIRRITKKTSENQDLIELEQLREEKEKAISALRQADEDIFNLQQKIDGLNIKLEKKNNEYTIKGGDIVAQKHDLMGKRANNMVVLSTSQEKLLDAAAGELPLLMVRELLKDIQVQGEIEHSRKTTLLAFEKTKEMYVEFTKKINGVSADIEEFISYIESETEGMESDVIYDLSDSSLYQIRRLNNNLLLDEVRNANKIIKERDKAKEKVDEIDSYLSVDIDESALNRIFKSIKELEQEISEAEVKLDIMNKDRATLNGAALVAKSSFNKKAENVLSNLEMIDSDERTVKYAHIAIDIITAYRKKLQERKTDSLAETMTDCYKKLANKKNLVSCIKMDSETLDLKFMNNQGEEIAKKRLSAGEKQLMVIALLWALAICSKKKLPVIIDTPLSRLDSMHREALIKTYFPNASDQTIILSTDSEIDEKYYNMMIPSIGDEFTLKYDDKEKKTTIKQGYFGWEGKR